MSLLQSTGLTIRGETQGRVNLWDFSGHNKVRALRSVPLSQLCGISNKCSILKVASLETRGRFIMSVAFSPDGKMIAAASQVRLVLSQLLHTTLTEP